MLFFKSGIKIGQTRKLRNVPDSLSKFLKIFRMVWIGLWMVVTPLIIAVITVLKWVDYAPMR